MKGTGRWKAVWKEDCGMNVILEGDRDPPWMVNSSEHRAREEVEIPWNKELPPANICQSPKRKVFR